MFDRRRTVFGRGLAMGAAAWPLTVGLFLEVIACSISVIGLVQGRNWWLGLLCTAAVLLAIPMVLRGLGMPDWLASVIDIAVFAGLIELFYGIGSVPSLFGKAMSAIAAQGVPAAPLPSLIFLFVIFGGVIAVLLDLIAVTLRLPALTAVVIGGVLVVPAVLQPDGLSLIALGAAAGAWLVVLFAGGVVRFGSRGGGTVALASGAAATLIAVIIAATAPGFGDVWRPGSSQGSLSVGSSVNPLIDLSKNLREPVPVPVLQYTTSNPQAEYLQLTTLDSFNGTVWQHRPSAHSQVPASGDLGSPQGLPATGLSTETYPTTLSIQGLASPWVPVPSATVKFLQSDRVAASYEPLDHTVDAASENLAGERYSTTSLDVTASLEQIDAIEASDPTQSVAANVQRDLYLPKSVPKIITSTTAQVVRQAGASNPFDEAVALQDYFQNTLNGFTYSTDTPDSIDGTSLQVVAKFLQQKTGYCIHFATAMAVMARALGIPSRIAMGYLPGTLERESASGFTYQVQSSDLHAWPQLYFAGIGWLNFEPTVSRGAAPEYTIPSVTSDQTDTTVPDAPGQQAAVPLATPSAAPLAQSQAQTPTSQAAQGHGAVDGLGLLIVLAALVSPFTARRLRRRGRIARLREDGRPARLAWEEVRDTARDLGLGASAAETPRAFAARIRESWPLDASLQRDLDEVLELVERSEYGPARPYERLYELADTTERVVRGLARARPVMPRLRALLLPVSLLQSRLGGRDREEPVLDSRVRPHAPAGRD